jgi:3-dehydroquinate synthase
MHTITIHTDSKVSSILIGEKLQNLAGYLPAGKSIIITDENILRYYNRSLPPFPVITIGLGESHKTMDTLQTIFKKLIEYEADRSTFIIGIGGGIVCDVTGFAASTYMRGLRFGFVSTTLLSQVDASVGGKNGVNFLNYKNMIGTFSQPEFVICDVDMLQTLDKREFRAGFAEIIKAAAIKDASLFGYLENHYADALRNNHEVIEKLISDAVQIKRNVVEQDEKEKGERRKLNFGHTFAHSIEHLTGMLHGEAVAIGMALAAKLSVKTGMLKESELERILNIIRNFELPVNIDVDFTGILDAIKKDKKRDGDFIHMILLNSIGNSLIHKFTFNELEKLIYDLRMYS